MNSTKTLRARDATGRRMRINWGLLWAIPIVAACLGLLFSLGGMRATQLALEVDPCATSVDNPFVFPVLISYAILIGGSLVALVVSVIAKNSHGIAMGIVAVISSPFLALFGVVMGVGGYGWHCPDY